MVAPSLVRPSPRGGSIAWTAAAFAARRFRPQLKIPRQALFLSGVSVVSEVAAAVGAPAEIIHHMVVLVSVVAVVVVMSPSPASLSYL